MRRGRTPGRGTRRGGTAAPAASTEPTDGPAVAEASTPATLTPTAGGNTALPTLPATGSVTRGGATARATRGPSIGRFRPKNVRRDEAERDNLARQEEQKASERAAAERRARGRSRFRSKRSRGDAMGSRGGFGRANPTASGPFSAGMSAGGINRIGGRTGIGGSSFGGGFGGSGGYRDSKTPGIKQADDVRFRETRINADKLHSRTPEEDLDSDDEAMMTALSNKAATSLPMGIFRKEHKDDEVVVVTNAELEAAENATGEEESLWVDGDTGGQPLMPQPAEEGVWGMDSKAAVKIKNDPELEDAMDIDSAVRSATEDTARRSIVDQKPKAPPPQDLEEQVTLANLQLLAGELGSLTIVEDGVTRQEPPPDKDGRLYLFQFPPKLPPLLPTVGTGRGQVKEEPSQTTMSDVPARPNHGAAVDLTQDESAPNAPDNLDDEQEEFEPNMLSHGGLVGKLTVRKSGRTHLDWGGMPMSMGPAMSTSFLATAVIVQENDEKPQPGVIGGESVGMGKIMGRFVVAPVWGDEGELEVDLSGLSMPQ
ncbi:hypothetical protein S7711_08318 [Stachybotrys chartarum IBT 7711]|uniref:DNA-directed RNA polymerase III RPC4 n=1 Tax=Stachybotrys chartarum (strain CBS 109288 / IBT 7711) TaxID=1280523 RepID=A0A084AJK0_STACB|nr:hypothetical protein S7711_08318 [Stachybotrys chartarum IBT 7711]KFA46340.1 hypothetical protein S40293_08652 [Stachybotrys chartarum IBT 40293]